MMPNARRNGPHVVLAILSLGAVGGLILVVVREARASRAVAPLSDYGVVPEFTLVSHEGRPVTRQSLAGRVWIADFIFTRCAGQCPMMSQRMASLQRIFQDVPDVQLVSFTVDPAYDSPQVLAGYARKLGVVSRRWQFVTGDSAAITTLAREGFHLGVSEGGSAEEPIIHSVKLALVDAHAHVRGYYDATDDAAVARLQADVTRLRRNPSP